MHGGWHRPARKPDLMNLISLPVAFVGTLLSILLLRPLARKLGLMDAPGGRKTHTRATPLIGGFGIYLGLLAGCLLNPDVLAHYQPLLVITTLLLVIGLIDDYYPLPAWVRMGVQVLAAWLMCTYGGNQLVTLGHLVGNWEMFLGRYTVIMTIFATVGVINAINMIDGMDGLSGGMAVICLGLLGITAGLNGMHPELLQFILILLASVIAFLVLNFRAPVGKPALIYLGDSGSTMLGFILAWVLIESSQGLEMRVIPATVALWFVAIPLMDTVYLLVARPLTGKSPFAPGNDHLHHLLAMHGLSHARVVVLLYLGGLVFGLGGLAIYAVPVLEPWSLYAFLCLFLLYIVLMRREKGTPEPGQGD